MRCTVRLPSSVAASIKAARSSLGGDALRLTAPTNRCSVVGTPRARRWLVTASTDRELVSAGDTPLFTRAADHSRRSSLSRRRELSSALGGERLSMCEDCGRVGLWLLLSLHDRVPGAVRRALPCVLSSPPWSKLEAWPEGPALFGGVRTVLTEVKNVSVSIARPPAQKIQARRVSSRPHAVPRLRDTRVAKPSHPQ